MQVMPIDAVYAWDLADDPHAHAGDVRRLPVRFLNHAVSSKMAAWLWRRGFEWCRFPLGTSSKRMHMCVCACVCMCARADTCAHVCA